VTCQTVVLMCWGRFLFFPLLFVWPRTSRRICLLFICFLMIVKFTCELWLWSYLLSVRLCTGPALLSHGIFVATYAIDILVHWALPVVISRTENQSADTDRHSKSVNVNQLSRSTEPSLVSFLLHSAYPSSPALRASTSAFLLSSPCGSDPRI
jgi:hypothetical protein